MLSWNAAVYRYYINIISYTINKLEKCPNLLVSFTICNIVCVGLGICLEITHISSFIPTILSVWCQNEIAPPLSVRLSETLKLQNDASRNGYSYMAISYWSMIEYWGQMVFCLSELWSYSSIYWSRRSYYINHDEAILKYHILRGHLPWSAMSVLTDRMIDARASVSIPLTADGARAR